MYRIRYLVLAAVLLITPPAYVAQRMNNFQYGNSAVGGAARELRYTRMIRRSPQKFGRSNMMLADLSEHGSGGRKEAMSDEIWKLCHMSRA